MIILSAMDMELDIDSDSGGYTSEHKQKKHTLEINTINKHNNQNGQHKFNPCSTGDLCWSSTEADDPTSVQTSDTIVNQTETERNVQTIYSSSAGAGSSTQYSFKQLQEQYRATTSKFFSNMENYTRLRKIVYHRDERIFSILLFFVIRYKDHSLYLCQRSYNSGPEVNDANKPVYSFYKPKDEYNRTLKKYKKRFYDFESKVGSGDLFWDGIRNPKFLVAPDNGPISLPLAKMIACYWSIEHGFDTVFWDNYPSILEHYEIFTLKTKKKYTEAHKQKKKKMRSEIEEKVIAKRDIEQQQQLEAGINKGTATSRRKRTTTTKCSRRKTRLSRELRREVTKQIQDRKRKMKEQAAQIANGEIVRKRRRPCVKKKTLATTMHFNPPSISL